jgi:nitronate monooxygenase
MLATKLCDLLDVRVPIIQAPIADSPRLAAAVANAGAFGMLGLTWTPVDDIAGIVEETRRLSNGRFGANLVIEEPQHERLDAVLGADVRLVSLFWGDPSPYVERIHAAGALAAYTARSVEDARPAVEAGVDLVVAQGWEAGGHVWGTVASLPLIPVIVDACAPTPVVAAGGVADGRGLAVVLALGAAGAWMGTRFVASAEAPFVEQYKRGVVAARETDPTLTTAFYVGWPEAPHRVLRNSTLERYEAGGHGADGDEEIVAYTSGREPIPRYSISEPLEGMSGDVEAMAMYAGQGSGVIREIKTVDQLVSEIAHEAEQTLTATARLIRDDRQQAGRQA